MVVINSWTFGVPCLAERLWWLCVPIYIRWLSALFCGSLSLPNAIVKICWTGKHQSWLWCSVPAVFQGVETLWIAQKCLITLLIYFFKITLDLFSFPVETLFNIMQLCTWTLIHAPRVCISVRRHQVSSFCWSVILVLSWPQIIFHVPQLLISSEWFVFSLGLFSWSDIQCKFAQGSWKADRKWNNVEL